jgi:hypothetical protein
MVSESLAQSAAAPAEHWIADIERSVRQRDPDVFFVLPRILRRILRHELDITSPWVRIPHRKSYVISRDRLSWLVAMDELGVDASTELPHRAMLIARPEEEQLKRMAPAALRLYDWRMHFHARIDLTLAERTAADRMTPAQLRQRIDRLGQQQFDEIRSVLKQEAMLTHPDDPRNVYAEFAAVFLELRAFAPDLLPLYFPSLNSLEAVVDILRDDVDAEMFLDFCRPPEFADDDPSALDLPPPLPEIAAPEVPAASARPKSARWFRGLFRAAEGFRHRGNVVRAAMLRCRALNFASPEDAATAEAALHDDLATLAQRLQAALELSDAEAAAWRQMFLPLVTGAVRGYWNSNARLLYDLQKVCVDHERETYRVDLLRWVRTLGKTPLRRPLPKLRMVLIAKHLRTATRRIPAARIDPAGRRELTDLLHRAAEQAEAILRSRLQPQIRQAFADVGIEPRDVVERVALHKMSAELLDVVVHRGFLTLGNLRDAFSRSQWKLPDLADAKEFAYGDALLRADQRFAAELDGVYQRGPFYLRWLQRMTSLFFGTYYGRFITKYIALPFGGAYVILAGLHYLMEESAKLFGTPKVSVLGHDAVTILLRTGALGIVLFGLIHWPAGRRAAVWVLSWTWRLVKLLLIDVPRALHKLPPVAWMMRSLPALIFRRYILSPVLVTLLVWQGLPRVGLYPEMSRWWALAVLVISFVILNSRMGRDSEELFWEWLGRTWHRFRVTVIVGLFNLIVDVFRQVMDAVERVLYTVDEWLRFRSGESVVSLGIKAVLGVVWSFVNAVIRFCVTLLIEPQVNPIKHFPVVTVSHKLILPFLPHLTYVLTNFTDRYTAGLTATAILTSIPGVFGFLAWELKENWRLYAANRSPTLRPVIVGSHGETLLRLLKPGFHSGTIPKLFAKRRRVARKSRHQPEFSRHSAYDERLLHEAESIRHFVEREFLRLLRESARFHQIPVRVSDVSLTTNRIDVTLSRDDNGDEPARVTFAEQSGWLLAGISEAGWMRRLTLDEQTVLSAALAGLYQQGAVDLVREHLERRLGSPPHPYDIAETGLIVWPTRSFEAEVHYSLKDRPFTTPRPRAVARTAGLEPVPIGALVFREHPIAWERWRNFWVAESADAHCPPPLLIDVPVLRS